MENATSIWNQVKDDSKKFLFYERLTPHICALFKDTNKCLSNFKADTVLDIGAGDKIYQSYVKCKKYVSLDVLGEVDVIGDGSYLPFKKGSFDMIICTQVLEHIRNPFYTVEEFSRVLKEGGIVFITVTTTCYLNHIPFDYFRYTKYGIEYLLNKNEIIIQKSDIICSGFIVSLELFYIGIYTGIYRIIKNAFIRRLLVTIISYTSFIILKLDRSYIKSIFPGNILVVGTLSKLRQIKE